jgi:P pilus assembly chaperone PapD
MAMLSFVKESSFISRLGAAAFVICTGHLVTVAQGSLSLVPQRVVLEGNKISEQINLVNTGTDTADYQISLIHLRMKEDGSFEEINIEAAGDMAAQPLVRYFPRAVTLAPKEAQVIRVQRIKRGVSPVGEYRSHLYVRIVPKTRPLGSESPTSLPKDIGVQLTPVFGVSIPLIVREGVTSVDVSLKDLQIQQLDDASCALTFRMYRSGNRSVFGDFTVVHQAPDGSMTAVGTVRGLAVYTPNALREVSIPLSVKSCAALGSGKLLLQFIARDTDDKNPLKAEATLQLP